MKETSDIVTWIIGGLATLGFFNYKHDKKSDSDKFKTLFDSQRVVESKLAGIEAEVKGIQVYFIQTLDDIKNQNSEIAKDVTEIKVGLASIPRREGDK